MKKLFLLLAVSGLILASCGKKAEPTPTPTPEPQQTVAPAPTPAPEATPVPEAAPVKKGTKATEVKKTEPKQIESNTAPAVKQEVKTVTAKPVERTLEEKIKHINEYSPEEQKAILKEAQQQNNATVGTSAKTKKTKN
jgi:hypothetical protein